MQTTRRTLLIGAAALPTLALSPGATRSFASVDPDAALFALVDFVKARKEDEDRAWERSHHAEAVVTADLGDTPHRGTALHDLSQAEADALREAWRRFHAARDAHPAAGEAEDAMAAWDAANDARSEAEERLRLMPAATVAGVLAKLRNLATDCAWPTEGQDGADVERWVSAPVDQAIADLEIIVAGRAGA